MYIRRKVFSLLQDEYGEERYFSTTDFEYDEELDDRFYSKKEETDKKEKKTGGEKKLPKSARGYGRAIILGNEGGLAGRITGGIVGDKEYEKTGDFKKSKKKARRVAALVGGLTNATTTGIGAGKFAKNDKKGAIYSTLLRTAAGAGAAAWGTGKGMRTKHEKALLKAEQEAT